MPLVAMMSLLVAFVPMAERCRLAIFGTPAVPETVPFTLPCATVAPPDATVEVSLPQVPVPLSVETEAVALAASAAPASVGTEAVALAASAAPASVETEAVALAASTAPASVGTEAVALAASAAPAPVGTSVFSFAVRPPDAEPKTPFACAPSVVRAAAVSVRPVGVSQPRALSTNEVSRLVCRMVFGALSDGFVSARSPAWRMPLVRMLTGGTTGADFDRAYGYLLKGFAGNDDRSKARAAAGWARRNLPDAEAADVYRAETRHWLNLGEGALAVDAANRMERARADYAVRACRLRAIAHATSGELEPARREIARFRASRNQTKAERDEFLYLEAWIALQEGDVASARRNLTAIVAESPGGATARKARAVLQSIGEGQ